MSKNRDAAYWREYRRTNARYLAKTRDPEWRAKKCERQREWRLAHPDMIAAQRERARARWMRYYEAHKDDPHYIANAGKRWLRERYLRATDATYAAFRRALQREFNRRHNDKTRKIPYRPRPACRIPEWFALGENPLDRASPWLFGNLDKEARCSCDNYALMQNVERKKRRNA